MSAGWSKRSLGDVATIYNGNSINAEEKKKKYLGQTQGLPFIATKDISNDGVIDYDNGVRIPNYTDFKIAHPNSVFVCAEGGSAGKKMAFVEQEVCFGNKLFALQPKKALLNGRYLYYFVQSQAFKEQFKQLITGIIGGVSSKKFKEIPIILSPLPEQQRIVVVLDREFAKIDALKANAEKSLQAAKDLFQATLKKELEPKEGWSYIPIGSVADLITKGASPKWQGNQYVSSGGILFITSENVREGFLDISMPKYVDTGFNKKQARSILQKDDVLVNIVGASIGRAAIFSLDVKDANINQAVALVRLNKGKVLPDYLCCFLNSKMAEVFYASMKKDTARANLSLENISNIVFPCPKDITEQMAVAQKLHYEQQICRLVENNYQKTLTLCDDLKQSLLRKAFNGEL